VTPRDGRFLRRRDFVAAIPLAALAIARAARAGGAQETAPVEGGAAVRQEPELPGASMEGDGYVPVRLPPKPVARPSMTPDARDAIERKLSCPCPCTLDVFTCRTSMPCGFSPRMHADVAALVEGGYSGEEIMAAFRQAYGEKVLMAPDAKGFNLLGYLMPFLAIGGGGVVLAAVIRLWRRGDGGPAATTPAVAGGTPDELARLDAAVRDEDDAR
jgi:cytochrome c-type biogenesis protein CcmH